MQILYSVSSTLWELFYGFHLFFKFFCLFLIILRSKEQKKSPSAGGEGERSESEYRSVDQFRRRGRGGRFGLTGRHRPFQPLEGRGQNPGVVIVGVAGHH